MCCQLVFKSHIKTIILVAELSMPIRVSCAIVVRVAHGIREQSSGRWKKR